MIVELQKVYRGTAPGDVPVTIWAITRDQLGMPRFLAVSEQDGSLLWLPYTDFKLEVIQWEPEPDEPEAKDEPQPSAPDTW